MPTTCALFGSSRYSLASVQAQTAPGANAIRVIIGTGTVARTWPVAGSTRRRFAPAASVAVHRESDPAATTSCPRATLVAVAVRGSTRYTAGLSRAS